jgi:hypothetical protein
LFDAADAAENFLVHFLGDRFRRDHVVGEAAQSFLTVDAALADHVYEVDGEIVQ